MQYACKAYPPEGFVFYVVSPAAAVSYSVDVSVYVLYTNI